MLKNDTRCNLKSPIYFEFVLVVPPEILDTSNFLLLYLSGEELDARGHQIPE